jgi:hypothetical protein
MAEDEESEFRAAMKRIEHSEGCRAAASLFDQLKVGKGAVPDFHWIGLPQVGGTQSAGDYVHQEAVPVTCVFVVYGCEKVCWRTATWRR